MDNYPSPGGLKLNHAGFIDDDPITRLQRESLRTAMGQTAGGVNVAGGEADHTVAPVSRNAETLSRAL